MKKSEKWVSFGRTRQRVSDLPVELRARLGIEDLPNDEEDRIENEPVKKRKTVEVRKSRTKREVDSEYNSKKEYSKSPDSNMDIVMKFVGWNLGRAWVKIMK